MKHPFYYIGIAAALTGSGFILKELLQAALQDPAYRTGALFIAGLLLVSASIALLWNTLKLHTIITNESNNNPSKK